MERNEAAVPPQSPRKTRKRYSWIVYAIGIVLLGGGVVQLAPGWTADAQIASQLAALPSASVTQPSADPTPSIVQATPEIAQEAVKVAPAQTVTPTTAPVVVAPPSIPIHLTCAKAGIDIPVLPLPPGDDPNVVNPPETDKAVFWNPKWGKVGASSDATALFQAHYAIHAYWPFNRLSDPNLINVSDTCTATAESGSVLTYRVERTVALTMDDWRADPQFAQLTGPKRGFDLILQACDASDYHTLKRLVGLKLVSATG
jgi:hypothetical protein